MTAGLVLLLAALGAAPGPSTVRSASGRYLVSFEPQGSPAPVGALHDWRARLQRSDGRPVVLAHVELGGGMPAHGHGFATEPKLRPQATPGELLMEGVRFHMAGRWELKLFLTDSEGTDVATAELDVGELSSPTDDPVWSEEEKGVLRSMLLSQLGAPPKVASNRVADDARAVALGHRLFFDDALGSPRGFSCASCHRPERQFADRRALSRARGTTDRNTPTVVGAAYARWQFWDGRRDSLWSQALVPLEATKEMGATRLEVVRAVSRRYADAYVSVFGPLPSLPSSPRKASPAGDAIARRAWQRLPAATREGVDRAFANVGKAIEAYQRQLLPGRAPFDRYVEAVLAGDASTAAKAMSAEAVVGLKIFLSSDAQCTRCHSGPLLTNGEFHNIATQRPRGRVPDFGRGIGLQAVQVSEFNCRGRYSDDPARACPELDFLASKDAGSQMGAFKVPSLRNVALTGPYMHDGRFATLRRVVEHYRLPEDPSAGMEFRPLFDMSTARLEALVAFLESLSGGVDAPAALLRRPPVFGRAIVRVR